MLGIITNVRDEKLYDKLKYTYYYGSFYGNKSEYTSHFCDEAIDKERLSEADYLAYKKIYDKYNKNRKLHRYSEVFVGIGIVSLVTLVIFLPVSIFVPLKHSRTSTIGWNLAQWLKILLERATNTRQLV